jgi:hypothetical protein
MDRLVLRNLKKRNILLLLGCSVFVAMGIFIVLSDHSSKAQMVGWANIVFFGLGVVVAGIALGDNRPRITIDEHGITDRTLKVNGHGQTSPVPPYTASYPLRKRKKEKK